MIDLLVVQTR